LRVGVFDSGVGGLTVTKSLLENTLFDEIIYYGDTAKVPYGVKDKNTIIRHSLEALEFLKNFDIQMLIVACNTVSAQALNEKKKNAPFDVVGVIKPGVLATINALKCKDSSILILGTRSTINSKIYQNLLEQYGFSNTQALSPSLFVPIVEEGIFEGKILESTMDYYFKDIKANPDAIILGCTHFPLISQALQKYFPTSRLIHSGEAIAEYLQNEYSLKPKDIKTKLTILASDNVEAVKKTAGMWFEI
jgi:glutamate racemase